LALEGYNRLKKNGFSLKDVPSLNFAKQEYRNNVDTVRAFVAERLMKSSHPEDRLKFSGAYKQYTSFCEAEGRKDVEDKKSFKKVLKELGFKIGNSSKDGNQVYIFNVGLLQDEEEV
jgi:phage/plasmid-associated DNA primase